MNKGFMELIDMSYQRCFYLLLEMNARYIIVTNKEQKNSLQREIHHVELCMQWLNQRKAVLYDNQNI